MLKVFDVGHGQSILFITPNGRVVLIDCAHHPVTGWHPTQALSAMGIRHVDALVVSNFDEDHARGLRQLYARGISHGPIWTNWRVTPADIRRIKNDLGDGIETLLCALDHGWGSTCGAPDAPWLGCHIFRTWALSQSDYWPYDADTNALSVVTEIKVSGVGIMIGGDMPASGWRLLLRYPRVPNCRGDDRHFCRIPPRPGGRLLRRPFRHRLAPARGDHVGPTAGARHPGHGPVLSPAFAWSDVRRWRNPPRADH